MKKVKRSIKSLWITLLYSQYEIIRNLRNSQDEGTQMFGEIYKETLQYKMLEIHIMFRVSISRVIVDIFKIY